MKQLFIPLLLCLVWPQERANSRSMPGPELPQAISTTLTPLLGVLKGVNMNSTADQAIVIGAPKYIVRRIIVTNASTSLTTAAGGVYTATSKGGTTVVAGTQIYTTLSGSTKFLDLTLAAGVTGDIVTATPLYFALTTGQGSAATADVYIIGDALP